MTKVYEYDNRKFKQLYTALCEAAYHFRNPLGKGQDGMECEGIYRDGSEIAFVWHDTITTCSYTTEKEKGIIEEFNQRNARQRKQGLAW